ncbi:MAG: hypothetical protein PHW69_02355 [Elusimicrobiaceae bacterium]|nr:hypothetical protein [Elusimicrobiaceae bacterium]
MTAHIVWMAAALTGCAGVYCLAVSRNVFKLILGADLVFKALVLFGAGFCGLDGAGAGRIVMVISGIEGLVIVAGLALAVRFVRLSGSNDIGKTDTYDD